LWKSYQHAYVTPNLHSFLGTFVCIWSNWDPTFVMLSLNCDFTWNLSMKYNNSCYFWLIIFFLNLNIKISHNDDWTMFGRSLNYNLKIVEECGNWTWMTSIHTYNMYFFCVLILKFVAIYNKLSQIIVLKESNCMCMSYIIINPWPSWIEIYDEFINLCTSIDACCILVSMRNNIWNIWKLWSWLISL